VPVILRYRDYFADSQIIKELTGTFNPGWFQAIPSGVRPFTIIVVYFIIGFKDKLTTADDTIFDEAETHMREDIKFTDLCIKTVRCLRFWTGDDNYDYVFCL